MNSTNYIFPGRFQPFHNGHIEVILSILNKINTTDKLIIAIIVDSHTSVNPIAEFEQIANNNHTLEMNPISSLHRLELINICVNNELCKFQNQILTTILPRPETNWEVVIKIIGSNHVWVVPKTGDKFDYYKSLFYKAMRAQFLEIESIKTINATYIRECINKKNTIWENLVPKSIIGKIKHILYA